MKNISMKRKIKNKKCKSTIKIKRGGKNKSESNSIPSDFKPIHEEEFNKESTDEIHRKISKEDKGIQKLIEERDDYRKSDKGQKHTDKMERNSKNNYGEIKLFIENKFKEFEKKNYLQFLEIKEDLMNIRSLLSDN